MQRFFTPHPPLWEDLVISEASFVHQIWRVLRSNIGDCITFFNGDGREYVYIIRSIGKKEVCLSFESSHAGAGDPQASIRLHQALPNKYEKIEYILQKGVEVWISEFIFFRSDRSQKLVLGTHKMERFREIAREATEQCYGNNIPSIAFLEGEFSIPEDGPSYVLHTEAIESRHLRDIDKNLLPINIFVGPEGGWSPMEISRFNEEGAQKLCLGERVLRTETTGPAVAFFLLQR